MKKDFDYCIDCGSIDVEREYERGGQGEFLSKLYEARDNQYLVVLRCQFCGFVIAVWIEDMTNEKN